MPTVRKIAAQGNTKIAVSALGIGASCIKSASLDHLHKDRFLPSPCLEARVVAISPFDNPAPLNASAIKRGARY